MRIILVTDEAMRLLQLLDFEEFTHEEAVARLEEYYSEVLALPKEHVKVEIPDLPRIAVWAKNYRHEEIYEAMTKKQKQALLRLVMRHGFPNSLSPLIGGDKCVMVHYPDIVIGVEEDGYAHS